MNRIVAFSGLFLLVAGWGLTFVITFLQDWVRVGVTGEAYSACAYDIEPIGTLGLFTATYDPSCVEKIQDDEARENAKSTYGRFGKTESPTTSFWPLFPSQTGFGTGSTNFTDCESYFGNGPPAPAYQEAGLIGYPVFMNGVEKLNEKLSAGYEAELLPKIENGFKTLNTELGKGYLSFTGEENPFISFNAKLKIGYEEQLLPKFLGTNGAFKKIDDLVSDLWASQLKVKGNEAVIGLSGTVFKIKEVVTKYAEGLSTTPDSALSRIASDSASVTLFLMCMSCSDDERDGAKFVIQAVKRTYNEEFGTSFDGFLFDADLWTNETAMYVPLQKEVKRLAEEFSIAVQGIPSLAERVESLKSIVSLCQICDAFEDLQGCTGRFPTIQQELDQAWAFCQVVNRTGIVPISDGEVCSAEALFSTIAKNTSALDSLVKPESRPLLALVPVLSELVSGCVSLGKEWDVSQNYSSPEKNTCQQFIINPTGNMTDQAGIPSNFNTQFALCLDFASKGEKCRTFYDFAALSAKLIDEAAALGPLFSKCKAFGADTRSECEQLTFNPTGNLQDQNAIPTNITGPFSLCIKFHKERKHCNTFIDFINLQAVEAIEVKPLANLFNTCSASGKVIFQDCKESVLNPTGNLADQKGVPAKLDARFALCLKYGESCKTFVDFMAALVMEAENAAASPLSRAFSSCVNNGVASRDICYAVVKSDRTGDLAKAVFPSFLEGNETKDWVSACKDDEEDARRISLAQKLVPSSIVVEGLAILACFVYIVNDKRKIGLVAGVLAAGGTALTLSALLLVRFAPVYQNVGKDCTTFEDGSKCYVAGTAQTLGYMAILLPLLSCFLIIGSSFCGKTGETKVEDSLTSKARSVSF